MAAFAHVTTQIQPVGAAQGRIEHDRTHRRGRQRAENVVGGQRRQYPKAAMFQMIARRAPQILLGFGDQDEW